MGRAGSSAGRFAARPWPRAGSSAGRSRRRGREPDAEPDPAAQVERIAFRNLVEYQDPPPDAAHCGRMARSKNICWIRDQKDPFKKHFRGRPDSERRRAAADATHCLNASIAVGLVLLVAAWLLGI